MRVFNRSDGYAWVESDAETLARELWERVTVASAAADLSLDASITYADAVVAAWRARFMQMELPTTSSKERGPRSAAGKGKEC